ncbi:hypothetical protein NDU88_004662 [Pleurodeles waltl]|uniref:Uncharacterized protein n=1 Tax=Pleurodeles waltl TaxID=8319 RepID=A0AAV7WWK1_PLEWA|nr:hypothetical protein NDU88_004662 [Pleurodeles waltl]
MPNGFFPLRFQGQGSIAKEEIESELKVPRDYLLLRVEGGITSHAHLELGSMQGACKEVWLVVRRAMVEANIELRGEDDSGT